MRGGVDTVSAYIWVSADLLDDLFIEVARVSCHSARNIIGVLETGKGRIKEGHLGAFPQIGLGGVEVLDPAMVSFGTTSGHVVLEDDDVGVWKVVGVDRGEDRSGILVDGLGVEDGRSRRQHRQQREAEE